MMSTQEGQLIAIKDEFLAFNLIININGLYFEVTWSCLGPKRSTASAENA